MKSKLLMCRPDYYGVFYEINPWMNMKKKADQKKAMKQWQDYYDLLTQKLEVDVELVDPVKDAPDMVFTANAGIVKKNIFTKSNFRYKQRRIEEGAFEKWFKSHQYTLKRVPKQYAFEGEGDALILKGDLYAGYRYRTDIEAHEIVSGYLKTPYYSLELCDKRFYHLDTCFAPLNDQSALVYFPAFETYAKSLLNENIEDLIKVPEQEAVKFACNAVVLGETIVMPKGCPETQKALKKRGFEVYDLDFDEFIKAGGAAKCMVLKI